MNEILRFDIKYPFMKENVVFLATLMKEKIGQSFLLLEYYCN